jgi:hypothetical protein
MPSAAPNAWAGSDNLLNAINDEVLMLIFGMKSAREP